MLKAVSIQFVSDDVKSICPVGSDRVILRLKDDSEVGLDKDTIFRALAVMDKDRQGLLELMGFWARLIESQDDPAKCAKIVYEAYGAIVEESIGGYFYLRPNESIFGDTGLNPLIKGSKWRMEYINATFDYYDFCS